MKKFSGATVCLFCAVATASADLVTSVSDLSAAHPEDWATNRPFAFCGWAMSKSDSNFFFADGTGSARIQNIKGSPARFGAGDNLLVRGRLRQDAWHDRILRATEITRRPGRHELPKTTYATAASLNDSRCEYRVLRMRGTVAAVVDDDLDQRFRWIVLITDTGSVNVALAADTVDEPPVNADVEVIGRICRYSTLRRNLGLYLSAHSVDVITPPPTDAFDAPTVSCSDTPHRRRTTGTVVAAMRRCFYLRDDFGNMMQVWPEPGGEAVRAGTRVTAVGFVVHNMPDVQLVNARVRVEDAKPSARKAPIDVKAENLAMPSSKEHRGGVFYHGQTVRIRGMAKYGPGQHEGTERFSLVCGTHEFAVDVSAVFSDAKDKIADGSEIEVTGLCIAEFAATAPLRGFPQLTQFVLVPWSPADISVIREPPWWTTGRLLALVSALIAAIGGILLWNLSLRRLAERRARALARVRIDREKSELKVEERTRLAVELHDSVSQTLTGIALQLDSAMSLVAPSDTRARELLQVAGQMLASCRSELQGCLWDLRSRTFDEKDMTEAILTAIHPHMRNVAAAVRFNVPRALLSDAVTHAILRIVRELVVNAIRHGAAKSIRVAGEQRDGRVRFSVRDDGCGFNPSAIGSVCGHFGIQGIRERIRRLGGTMSIDSKVGRGTRVFVELPSREREPDDE